MARSALLCLALGACVAAGEAAEWPPPPADAELLASISLKITGGEDDEGANHDLQLHDGVDPEHAAFRFCAAHNLGGQHVASLAKQLADKVEQDHGAEKRGALPTTEDLGSKEKHVKRGKGHLKTGDLVAAAVDFARGGENDKVGQLGKAAALWEQSTTLIAAGDWEAANDALAKVEGVGAVLQKSQAVLVRRATVYWHMGKWPSVNRMCGHLLREASHRGSWKEGQPRTECARLAGMAALEMGDVGLAKKVIAIAVKADPDCSLKALFKKVQELGKHIKNANKWLKKSYNHRALEQIADAETLVAEMSVSSNRLKAETALLSCRAESAVKHHEIAIIKCEEAEKYYNEPIPGLVTDPFKLILVKETRAKAHTNDLNYDEATRDYRDALTMLEEVGADRGRLNEMRNKWRKAQQQEKMWAEKRSNADHIKILDLPQNIDELNKKSRCKWLKKQHRKMVIKWHPDKAKGNKKRAMRKFSEVAEAATELDMHWDCSAKGRTEKRERAEEARLKAKREAEERRKNPQRGRRRQYRRGPR